MSMSQKNTYLSTEASQQRKIHSDRRRGLHSSKMSLSLLIQVLSIVSVGGRVVDFELDVGGIPDDFSEETGAQFSCKYMVFIVDRYGLSMMSLQVILLPCF